MVTQAEVQAYLATPLPELAAELDEPPAPPVTPRVCRVRGAGVPAEHSFQPGWSSQLVRDAVPGVAALALDPAGQLYLGGRSEDVRRRVVSRLEPDGSLADSRTQAEPDALAIDSRGRLWLGSYDVVKTLGPPNAGPDAVLHQIHGGGNIDDLAVTDAGDRLWVALRDGRVVELVGDQERPVVPFGEPALLAVDGRDNLWVSRKESSGTWLYRLQGTRPRAWTRLDDAVPGLISVDELSWGPDGALYVLAQVQGRETQVVVRMDPHRPAEARTWATGLATARGRIDSLAWDDASACLYLGSSDEGKVFRSCPCEASLDAG